MHVICTKKAVLSTAPEQEERKLMERNSLKYGMKVSTTWATYTIQIFYLFFFINDDASAKPPPEKVENKRTYKKSKHWTNTCTQKRYELAQNTIQYV